MLLSVITGDGDFALADGATCDSLDNVPLSYGLLLGGR